VGSRDIHILLRLCEEDGVAGAVCHGTFGVLKDNANQAMFDRVVFWSGLELFARWALEGERDNATQTQRVRLKKCAYILITIRVKKLPHAKQLNGARLTFVSPTYLPLGLTTLFEFPCLIETSAPRAHPPSSNPT
jgi:hypothetical protein